MNELTTFIKDNPAIVGFLGYVIGAAITGVIAWIKAIYTARRFDEQMKSNEKSQLAQLQLANENNRRLQAEQFEHQLKQLDETHKRNLAVEAEKQKSQVEQLKQTHTHNLEMEEVKQKSQEDLRDRQFAEADLADRLRIAEYVDLLVPKLAKICRIDYLLSDNKYPDELKDFCD